MDKTMKERWVEALRSGKYRQVQGQLKERRSNRHHAFCCLGVLCNLYDPELWERDEYSRTENYRCGLLGNSTQLPDNLRCKLGISSLEQETLIAMNDGEYGGLSSEQANDIDTSRKYNFREIADWIEEHL